MLQAQRAAGPGCLSTKVSRQQYFLIVPVLLMDATFQLWNLAAKTWWQTIIWDNSIQYTKWVMWQPKAVVSCHCGRPLQAGIMLEHFGCHWLDRCWKEIVTPWCHWEFTSLGFLHIYCCSILLCLTGMMGIPPEAKANEAPMCVYSYMRGWFCTQIWTFLKCIILHVWLINTLSNFFLGVRGNWLNTAYTKAWLV